MGFVLKDGKFFLILNFKWFLYFCIWSLNYELDINSVKYIYMWLVLYYIIFFIRIIIYIYLLFGMNLLNL